VGQKGSIAWQPTINLITGPYHEKIIESKWIINTSGMSCGNCAHKAEVKAAPPQRLRPGRWGLPVEAQKDNFFGCLQDRRVTTL